MNRLGAWRLLLSRAERKSDTFGGTMQDDVARDRAWAILFARSVLGLIFFMAGVWKVFGLGPMEHARQLFVEPYAKTFLPAWSLWATGYVVPFVELVAGALVLIGLRTREALIALAACWCSSRSGIFCSSHYTSSTRMSSRGRCCCSFCS